MASSKYSVQGALSFFKELAVIIVIAFVVRTFGFGLYQVPSESMETTMLVGERFFADKFTPFFTPFKHNDIIAFNTPEFEYSSNAVMRLFQEYVWGPSNWTKRIIGMPGDHIVGAVEEGKPVVYRNGQKLDEPYLNKYPLVFVRYGDDIHRRSYDSKFTFKEQPFYRVKDDNVIMGPDGKPHVQYPGAPLGKSSFDTFDVQLKDDEYWVMGDNRLNSTDSRRFGALTKRLIHGKIVFRIWSIDSDESWWIIDLLKHPIDFWTRVRWSRFFQRIS